MVYSLRQQPQIGHQLAQFRHRDTAAPRGGQKRIADL
jgi:hypothetical protein